jgi:hypothetical protein
LLFYKASKEAALVMRLQHRKNRLDRIELGAVGNVEQRRQLQLLISLPGEPGMMHPHVVHEQGNSLVWEFISQLRDKAAEICVIH